MNFFESVGTGITLFFNLLPTLQNFKNINSGSLVGAADDEVEDAVEAVAGPLVRTNTSPSHQKHTIVLKT